MMSLPAGVQDGWKKRALILSGALLLLCGLVFVTSLPAICPMRVVFHVPCPSCGMTRAVRMAAHGDVIGSLHMHPVWPMMGFFLGWILTAQAIAYLRTGRGEVKLPKWLQWYGIVLLVVLMGVWFSRFFGAFGGPAPV